jgi:hypothetical protein
MAHRRSIAGAGFFTGDTAKGTQNRPLFKAENDLSAVPNSPTRRFVYCSSMPIRAGLLTVKMTPPFIRAHGTGLRA